MSDGVVESGGKDYHFFVVKVVAKYLPFVLQGAYYVLTSSDLDYEMFLKNIDRDAGLLYSLWRD